jgi:ribosomal protein L11 methyltransferase
MPPGKPNRSVPHGKPQSYTCVTIETPAAAADDAAGILVAFGSTGCEIRKLPNRGFARHSSRARLHAYFDQLSAASLRRINDTLQEAGMIAGGEAPAVKTIEDPGWATMWQKRFEPFPVGERFLIVPPWDRAAADGRVSITIQPGQAFGTGHHASTFGVLHLMEGLFAVQRFNRVLDVGAGSGILAIASHKLGARKVVAIDVDSVALENAVENADLNHVDDAVRFSAAPLGSIRGRFDLITANILTSVVVPMAPQLKTRLRPGGYLILAGILAREADAVVSAYTPELQYLRTRADGAWRALLLRR